MATLQSDPKHILHVSLTKLFYAVELKYIKLMKLKTPLTCCCFKF